jgi:hypothetical protein
VSIIKVQRWFDKSIALCWDLARRPGPASVMSGDGYVRVDLDAEGLDG